MWLVIPNASLVDLSRAQFGFTALFHFLFVPLTLGLTWLLVVMEAAYLKTGKVVYKDMTKFWAKLLAINFAMGILTGFTLEFEFGQNWAYFARIIGGSFGPILAIEGITAFMLEATMLGVFFFGWDKLSKRTHFIVTILMAVGASLSIVNILAANSWMQDPHATFFDVQKMGLQLTSILALYLNKLAQVRVGHVAYAGFVTSSIFMMGISAFYLLKGRDINFAKRSFAIGAGFGLICILVVGFYGDQNGLIVAKDEPEKMAAIEAQWTTQKAPASWYITAIPNQKAEKNSFVLSVPYALSLIATHSLTGTVEGLKEIMAGYKQRVKKGMVAYGLMEKIRKHQASARDQSAFKQVKKDLGFGFLLKRYAPQVVNATPSQINAAVKDAIPNVATAFWTFRVMVGCWLLMLGLFALGVFFSWRDSLQKHRWFLRLTLYMIPIPYLAAEVGWVLAEVGRQPWVVHEIIPTFMGVSSLATSSVLVSLSGFVLFYVLLLLVELFLMFKYARLGPSSLGTGRYHLEQTKDSEASND